MSSGSRDRLPDREGSGAAMCTVAPNSLRGLQSVMYPMAPDPTSLLGGGAPGYHASNNPLWAVGLKHKEKPNRPTCVARPTCSQRTRARFQGA
jgi:hypothetical protein